MQEINWGNFKAKYDGKEQRSFEWLGRVWGRPLRGTCQEKKERKEVSLFS